MFKKYNFVVIIPDESKLDAIKPLSIVKPIIMTVPDGRVAVIGHFAEKDIASYEHYPASSDWQTSAAFQDQPL